MLHFIEQLEKSKKAAEQDYKLAITDNLYIVSNYVSLTAKELKKAFPENKDIQIKFKKFGLSFFNELDNSNDQYKLIEYLAQKGQ